MLKVKYNPKDNPSKFTEVNNQNVLKKILVKPGGLNCLEIHALEEKLTAS